MGLKLTELDEYLDPSMSLTVLGREYQVQPVSGEMGLWCRRLAVRAGAEVTDESTGDDLAEATERVLGEADALPPPPGDPASTFEERLLADAMHAMIADQVPDPYIQFCAQTAYWRVLGGDRAAELYWTSGGNPQRSGPANRQERRAAAKRAASGSGTMRTGAARTTRSRASGTGTSTPSTSGKSRPAKPSRGTRSSTTGA